MIDFGWFWKEGAELYEQSTPFHPFPARRALHCESVTWDHMWQSTEDANGYQVSAAIQRLSRRSLQKPACLVYIAVMYVIL